MLRQRTRFLATVATVATLAAIAAVACTLNPQPLPPESFEGARNSDAGADAGSFGSLPPATPQDAGAGKDSDADAPAGDAGDAAPDADGG